MRTPEQFLKPEHPDDTIALEECFNGAKLNSYNNSVVVKLAENRQYNFSRPLKITCGALKTNFRLIVYGNGAQLEYTGKRFDDEGNPITAFQIGDKENNKKALYCSLRDFELSATTDGVETLCRLDYGNFCSLYDIYFRGPGNNNVGTGLFIEDQQTLHLSQVSVGYAKTGMRSGELNNNFRWDSGKVHHCDYGIWHDGSKFNIENIDCSNCRLYGAVLENASKGILDIRTEEMGPGVPNDQAIVKIINSRNIKISGLLDCKVGAFEGPNHVAWGADVYGSTNIKFDNVECLMPMKDLYRSTNSTIFRDELTNVRRSRL